MRWILLAVGTALALAGLVLFPLAGGDFYTQMVTRMMILAIFAMSLDLLQGVTGLVSLGHAAYFGLAGYVLASRRGLGPDERLASAVAHGSATAASPGTTLGQPTAGELTAVRVRRVS